MHNPHPEDTQNLRAELELTQRELELARGELARGELAHWKQRSVDRGSALRNANETVKTLIRVINQRIDANELGGTQ